MPTVPNLNAAAPAGYVTAQAIDPALSSYNRVVASTPQNSLTPQFVGEMVLDTSSQSLWRAMSALNNGWAQAGVFG